MGLFTWKLSGLPGAQVAHSLAEAVRQKCSPEDVVMLLKEVPGAEEAGGGGGDAAASSRFNPLKIDVLIQTLLHLGAKSFSHSFAAISKYHYVFKTLAESEEAQICILKSVFELWRDHQQMMVVIIDKMLKTQILECSAVATGYSRREMSHEASPSSSIFIYDVVWLTQSF
ncbi:hypothetical protein LSTR_LSTR014216 [Laodelphax striatellus]|uniref:MIF4G-like type 2 domain-containing protein n=1 Tax=Laodelphax striatellus TaxID=195883 RepID=A0A482X866_LAOST|nr:hypothetical protein LSTR_LSTR014216 [Laodelphax striatellus]